MQSEQPAATKQPSNGLLDNYLSREQMADALGITVRTLARWHWARIGPPSAKIAGRRMYRRDKAIAWIDAQGQ